MYKAVYFSGPRWELTLLWRNHRKVVETCIQNLLGCCLVGWVGLVQGRCVKKQFSTECQSIEVRLMCVPKIMKSKTDTKSILHVTYIQIHNYMAFDSLNK